MDEWVTKASEAVEVSLVQAAPAGLRTVASFNPMLTYSIFGDDETIFGYKDLKISLRFHASDMRPNLQVSSSRKMKAVDEREPVDIAGVLRDYLPAVAFQKASEFEAAVAEAATHDYTPPGERVHAYTNSDGRYEIWKSLLSDPATKQLVDRVQIMVPFFIEGGTFIGGDDAASLNRWTIFTLFRTRQRPGSADRYDYEFAGYATVHRFLLPLGVSRSSPEPTSGELALPNTVFPLTSLPCRSRISQFLVLPPFQGKGNAGQLYRTIYATFLAEPQTVEITVEDPSEAFDNLRDAEDLRFLSSLPEFVESVRIDRSVPISRSGPSPEIVSKAVLDPLRRSTKMVARQFGRVVEMYLMQKLPAAVQPTLEDEGEDEDEGEGKGGGEGDTRPSKTTSTKEQRHEYALWRLLVKQRLYRQNRDVLGSLEKHDRATKLEETLRSVELEYARILSVCKSRAALAAAEDARGASVAKHRLSVGGEDRAAKKPRA